MVQLDDLKQIMDEQMADLIVDAKLTRKTMKRIFRTSWTFKNTHFMQIATLFSTFVLMFSLSINFFSHKTTTLAKYNIENLSVTCSQDDKNPQLLNLNYSALPQVECEQDIDGKG